MRILKEALYFFPADSYHLQVVSTSFPDGDLRKQSSQGVKGSSTSRGTSSRSASVWGCSHSSTTLGSPQYILVVGVMAAQVPAVLQDSSRLASRHG